MCGVYHGCAVIRGPQKKMAAIMSSGARVAQEPQKIEDDVIGCACADHWLHMRSSWGPNPAATTGDPVHCSRTALNIDGDFNHIYCTFAIFCV